MVAADSAQRVFAEIYNKVAKPVGVKKKAFSVGGHIEFSVFIIHARSEPFRKRRVAGAIFFERGFIYIYFPTDATAVFAVACRAFEIFEAVKSKRFHNR